MYNSVLRLLLSPPSTLHSPEDNFLSLRKRSDNCPVSQLCSIVQRDSHQVRLAEDHQVGEVSHQAGVLEPPPHLVLVGDLTPVAALVREDDGDHRDHHPQPGAVVDMTGPASPDALCLADPRVMSVDIDSLLHLCLSVPHYRVEVTTLVNLHLQQPRHQGGSERLPGLPCK